MRIESGKHPTNGSLNEILHLRFIDITLLNLGQHLGKRFQLFVGFRGMPGPFPTLAEHHAQHQRHHHRRAYHPESSSGILFHHITSFPLPVPYRLANH